MSYPLHLPINARYVDDDVDHVTAKLVALNVHWVGVRGDVDLGQDVEQKSLLYTRVLKDDESSRR